MNYTKLIFILAACAAVIFISCSSDSNPATYTVNVTFDDNGTAEADKTTAEAGEEISLTAEAADGYLFEKWTVQSGGAVLSGTTLATATFTMPPANVSIKATFIEIPTYAVTVTSVGGSAGADKTTAKEGEQITLTATAADGYLFEKWTVESGGAVLSSATDNPATFTMPAKNVSVKAEFVMEDEGIIVNGVKWAASNVDAPGTFAANPENRGMFYQWNRRTGWTENGNSPIPHPSGVVWGNPAPTGDEWEVENDPCPEGWRIPSDDEYVSLCDAEKTMAEWMIMNGTTGYKFTDKNSGNSVFLPTAGWLFYGETNGVLQNVGTDGYYWQTSPLSTNDRAYYLYFFETKILPSTWITSRNSGFSVRCVAEM